MRGPGLSTMVAGVLLMATTPLTAAQSPVPGIIAFTGSGAAGVITDPFVLQPGDHRLAYTAQAPAGEDDCGMGFALKAPDGSYFSSIGNNGAYVPAAAPHQGETWFLVPAAGEYVLEIGGDCDWSATLTAEPSPLDGMVPITIAGAGAMQSPSFALAAGDHLLRYRATNPSATEQCIFFGPGIVTQGPYAQSQGDPIDAVVDPGATLEGEVAFFGLAEGRYALFINYAWCSVGLAESIAWEVVIDPA